MIAINSTINSCEIKTRTNAEILWVKIQCRGHRDIFVAACYRPNVNDKTFTQELRSSLAQLQSKRKRTCGFIIGGDFNFPGWDWQTSSLKPCAQMALHTEFQDLLDDIGLTQHICEPTRRENILDLVATNMPDQINRVKIIPGISDHEIPYLEVSVKPIFRKQQPRKVWLFDKTDWPKMAAHLDLCFNRLNQEYNPCPDQLWTKIKDLIIDAMESYIQDGRAHV